ncbi:hypothetical protein CDFC105_74300 [Clostridioides difficile]|nr:hypothetical protein CDFC105_74300 [Clostridioides difficile]
MVRAMVGGQEARRGVFFFQAEDGIRDRSPLVGSEMCIRDRYKAFTSRL